MGRVVLVTGATGGLGSAIALRFGRQGDRVVVHYYASTERAEALCRQIEALGGEALAARADVRDYAQVRSLVNVARDRWDRVDVLVAAAGGTLGMLGRIDKTIIEHEESDWDLVVDTNLKGAFHAIKACAPLMMEQQDGHIVVVASITGIRGNEKRASYAAAKAGVMGLAKAAAWELGKHNVKVNAVAPGLILHERVAGIILQALPKLSAHAQSSQLLGKPITSAGEFADFIAHLTTMQHISGQTLNLDSQIAF